MKTYLEVSIMATESQREVLIPSLVELGCQGFQETDNTLLCYFDKSRWDADSYTLFRHNLRKNLELFSVNADVQYRDIEETNWNAEWEKSLTPIEIGRRFVIQPSWITEDHPHDRLIIRIDPKMSFGTGYHESTRLILELMEAHIHKGEKILDVGTGTGILAIAGIKLGAASAIGIDIDVWALENAHENTLLNGVDSTVMVMDKEIHSFPASRFNSVCANIMLTTILEMLPEFYRITRPSGKNFLSGILTQERDKIIAALQASHFTLLDECSENEWIALAAQKQ
jgi:ribosomal protein L11 methyltransferase